MAKEILLDVSLPKLRDDLGLLKVVVDGQTLYRFRVLGRGSATVGGVSTHNPSHNPLLYAGNTPTGDYKSSGIESTHDMPQSSYGPWGAVKLEPFAGQALEAKKLGRDRLLIHGGAHGQFHGFRSTKGCLRLSNLDMKYLIDLISREGKGAVVKVHVRDY